MRISSASAPHRPPSQIPRLRAHPPLVVGQRREARGAVAGAQVDLNPHQVDAALFAFKSPLSNGALLADEVGLGKTIEAGIVLSQQWAERKRRILIITPSNLRKQWHQELDREVLPAMPRFLKPSSYNAGRQGGQFQSFRARQPEHCHLLLPVCAKQGRGCSADSMGSGRDRRSPPPAQCLQAFQRHRQHAEDGACRYGTSSCSPPRRSRTRCWSCSVW